MANVHEQERVPETVEEQALKEVEGYIEQVEKQAEASVSDVLQPSAGATPTPTPVYDDMGKIVVQAADSSGKASIVLPLDEEEIKKGLHHKVVDGLRWLAEWCIYIIKKYPGRVFYSQNKDGIR